MEPRHELFTPRRVAGAPSCGSLLGYRETQGTFVASGAKFRVADAWTTRATAHRSLGSAWTGTTRFIFKNDQAENPSLRRLTAPSIERSLIHHRKSDKCSKFVNQFFNFPCMPMFSHSRRQHFLNVAGTRQAPVSVVCATASDVLSRRSGRGGVCGYAHSKQYDNKHVPTHPRRWDALT